MEKNLYITTGLAIICFPLAYVYILALYIRDFMCEKTFFKEGFNMGRMIILSLFIIVILFSRYKFISLKYSLLYILAMSVYVYFDKKDFNIDVEKFSLFIMKCLFFVLIIGVIIYRFPVVAMPMKWVDASNYNIVNRMYSTFFNPNIYGYFLSCMIICLSSLGLKKDYKYKAISNLLFLASAVCLYFTYSRTAWFALLFAIFFIGIFCDKRYFLYGFLVFSIIFIGELVFKTNRASVSAVIGDSSFEYRLEMWRISFEIIKDHPLFGIGVGTYYKYTAAYSDIVVKYIEHCHNVYLQLFMSFGILPISCVVAFYFKKWIKNIKIIFFNRKDNFSSMLIAFIIFTFISGVFDAVILTPQIFLLTVIFFTFLMKKCKNRLSHANAYYNMNLSTMHNNN